MNDLTDQTGKIDPMTETDPDMVYRWLHAEWSSLQSSQSVDYSFGEFVRRCALHRDADDALNLPGYYRRMARLFLKVGS